MKTTYIPWRKEDAKIKGKRIEMVELHAITAISQTSAKRQAEVFIHEEIIGGNMTVPKGKCATNTIALIETILSKLDITNVKSFEITNYQQLGEFNGEIVLPTVVITMKE